MESGGAETANGRLLNIPNDINGPEEVPWHNNPMVSRCKIPDRLRQLDGLRGVAACIVGLIFHARLLYDGKVNPFAGTPGIEWLQRWGWSMVDLFFVLSGYVFSHCYLQGWRMRPGTTLGDFAVSRIARLMPLQLAMTLFAVLVLDSDRETTWENVLLSATMLHVFTEDPTATLNGPAWSLSVEMLCYTAFAVAALASPRALKLTAVAAIGWGSWQILAEGPWAGSASLIGRGLVGFFAGLVLRKSVRLTDRIPTFIVILALIVPLLVGFAEVGLVPVTLIAWPAAILLALRTNVLLWPPATWLGDRSYAIYLNHILVYTIIGTMAPLAGVTGTIAWLAVTAFSWLVVLVLANALYETWEKPAQAAIPGRYRAWLPQTSRESASQAGGRRGRTGNPCSEAGTGRRYVWMPRKDSNLD